MTADLWTIGRLEFIAAARLKWIRLLSAALALLAAAAAYSAGAANDIAGADGFARTTMSTRSLTSCACAWALRSINCKAW